MIYLNGQPLNVTVFPDKTSQVWKLNPSFLNDSFRQHIEWVFENEGEIVQLAQLVDLLEKRQDKKFPIMRILELPYLPYGRQDKNVSNDATFALHSFAHMVNQLHFAKVIIHDPHSEVALQLIHNSEAVYPIAALNFVIAEVKADTLCYPDKGAKSKYTSVYGEIKLRVVYGEKVRDQSSGKIISYDLYQAFDSWDDVKNKNVLIVDDICDGGATFTILAKDLLAKGAKSVALFVTHGIFSRGLKPLFESGIQRIYTQDGEASEEAGQIIYRRL